MQKLVFLQLHPNEHPADVEMEKQSAHNDGEVARHELVLKNSAVRQLNLLALVGDNDNSATKGDASAEGNVTADSQVVQFEHRGHLLEPEYCGLRNISCVPRP